MEELCYSTACIDDDDDDDGYDSPPGKVGTRNAMNTLPSWTTDKCGLP